MKSNHSKSPEKYSGALKHARQILLSRADTLCRTLRRIAEQLNADAERALTIMEFSVNHKDAKAVYAHSSELLKQIDAPRHYVNELNEAAASLERAIERYEKSK